MIAGVAGIVRRVSLIGRVRDVQIGDVDQVQMLFAQIGDESRKIRKGLRVHRKGTIAILIIDIEVDDVGGNSVISQASRNFPQL